VCPVEVRIVEEALPPDRRAWLLEVYPHDVEQLRRQPSAQGAEPACVVEGGLRVVDGAGSDDGEQAPVRPRQDVPDGGTRPHDDLVERVRAGKLPLHVGRRYERLGPQYVQILGSHHRDAL